MRSLISFSAAILLTLAALSPGSAAAGQSPKSKAKARSASSRTASQAATKSKTSSVPAQTVTVVPTATAVATPEPQGDGAHRITPVAAREAIEKGQAIVVDVRSEESYNAGHVKGARWINLNEIEARIKELPRDKMIITYCS
jgi:predicted sulfurtransferase